MGKEQKNFDYESIKKATLSQICSGKSLFGKDGAFAPMLKDILKSWVTDFFWGLSKELG
jgi:putative transposase